MVTCYDHTVCFKYAAKMVSSHCVYNNTLAKQNALSTQLIPSTLAKK